MNESNNNKNDQPTDEQQPSDETQAEYREISEEELKQILEEHKKWVESDGKEGKRAYLIKRNLKQYDFNGANLQQANLSGANLQDASFEEANLQKAELGETNLQKAYLWNANLRDATLSKANLQEAYLLGANLQDASLKEANLQKAFLLGANLQNAYLLKANLQDASLSEANLQEADLVEANFQGARLNHAKLRLADLSSANLKKANLSSANLQETNLYKADMRNTVLDGVKGLSEANIQYTNMEGATGLLGNEFAQADLTGTKLPENIEEFKALETVEKTSQNARKIFFAMLLGCVYSWLTIATTTDVRLLTNTASSPLPIIGTEIPIAWFYIAAPLVLICLYFYFHLYLDNLWGALASLPAIFPDGKRLDERAYPWLLNTLVRRHFKRLKSRPLIARMKEWITIFLAWVVVPFTMIAFWLRYIPRHEWFGTCFHIGLIVVSVAFAIIFYRLCALTLQGKEKTIFRLQNFWSDRRFYYGLSVVLLAGLFSLLSYGAIDGVELTDQFTGGRRKVNFYKINEFIPWGFKKIGYDVFANFREKAISEKPDNYWEIKIEERLESVNGAKLKEADLRNADMYRAFLIRADLRNSNLQNANLESANLQNANLGRANLQNAKLWNVDLQNANLEDANFQNAKLICRKLTFGMRFYRKPTLR
jgi:uncharacterized protein YjbI with pentapeptide repeats